MPRRASSRADRRIRRVGGCTFAECPDLPAPEARIVWHAELDPETLPISIIPMSYAGPDHIDLVEIAPWLTFIRDASGLEHAVLSDGWHHLRLDVAEGSLSVSGLVLINYAVAGLDTAWRRLIAVRRFLDLVRNRRFSNALYPPDPRIDRWLALLRVHDAMRDGASQREIGKVLFGEARVQREWYGPSDSLRSRIRRLVRDARAMAQGGYRTLLQRRPGER